MKKWNPQFETLNHFRGIAVLAVVLFHGFGAGDQGTLHAGVTWFWRLAHRGWMGVDMFFVISGYCIAANVQGHWTHGRGPIDFIKGRFWRIAPTYWAAFALTMILYMASRFVNHTSVWLSLPPTPREWIGNILLIQPALHTSFYQIVYWSLSAECAYYVIVMILFALSPRIPPLFLYGVPIAAAFIVMGFVHDHWIVEGWAEFVCGFILFYAVWQRALGNRRQQRAALAVLMAMTIGAGIAAQFQHSRNFPLACGFAWLLYAIYEKDAVIAAWKPIRWLHQVGIFSYSLYLMELSLQNRITNPLMRLVPRDSLSVIPVQMLAWVVAISGAYAFYRVVEKPIQDWRKTGITPIKNRAPILTSVADA